MADQPDQPLPPVVIDLGKVGRKRLKKLKKGRGRLIDEILVVVDQVREEFAEELGDREVLPVVLLYGKKDKKKKRRSLIDW